VNVAVLGLVVGTSELVERHVLTGDVLDDVGPGDEHVALIANGDDEVGLDGEYTAPPAHLPRMIEICGTSPDNSSCLRTEFGGTHGQRRRSVLDAGAAGVVDSDDRAADHGHPLHQSGDLAAEHLADGALEDGLVMAEHADGTALMVAWPVTTPSPNRASASPGVFANAPISKKLPGSMRD